MDDCLIVGAGVVGLSLAYELAGHGLAVRLVERGAPGREASWAGAGILPPGNRATATDAYAALQGLSVEMHAEWAARLREETGIDNGYRRCGALYLARTTADAELLELGLFDWQQRGIRAERLSYVEARRLEPALADDAPQMAVHLPDEAQLRNPWHLRALETACRRRGVQIESGVAIEDFERQGRRVVAALAADGRRAARAFCLAGGAWTGRLAATLGVELPVRPILGQMALLRTERPLLTRVINVGPRYLVPREDGRVLVGSTEEDVGFVKRNTDEAVAGLLQLAADLVPGLAEATREQCWSGLRPGSPDGMPYLSLLPDWDNATIAAGHFRSGLTLSPGTALLMSQLIRGQQPDIDLRAFRVGR